MPFQTLTRSAFFVALAPALALAQEHGAEPKPGLLTSDGGLMFWSLIVFIALFFILSKFAFGPITQAVRAREDALTQAIEDARKDREAAAKLLADHQARIEAARDEAQKVIVEGRATAEAMKASMLDDTHKQQQDLLDRARRDIDAERVVAIAELRREAVGLAIAAAGRVIEHNLDDAQNRKLVEQYLATIQ
ncbi:MAG: F0F1 ATP synthase subunit B [Gemmatimonadaceae bacterium]|nr:F0F1 ATP synthase subunit B [Gemmatimonadaceae bacterium]